MFELNKITTSVETLDTNPNQSTTHTTKLGNAPVDTTDGLGQNQLSQQFAYNTGATDTSLTSNSMKKSMNLYMLLGSVAILAGVATGFGGYKLQAQSTDQSQRAIQNQNIQQLPGKSIQVGDVFGVNDSGTFSDSAQGYLKIGGIDGEGSHRLLRQGGASQTVYLTSSITDLNPLEGMEVKVSGETFKGQKAGWLMDVGRVEVIKSQGEVPAGN